MTTLEEFASQMDMFIKIMMGIIVMFMQAGFAFYEAGTVRSKNVTNILIKNVLDSSFSGVAYWMFGYAFAYGEGNDFIGLSNFALYNAEESESTYADFFFQYTFAAATATIVSGSVAERCDFIAYFAYSFFITGFVYPIATHWYWGGGFLVKGIDYGGDIGVVAYYDFSGASLVHVLGGVAGVVGAAILGPRIGRFNADGSVNEMRGHSLPFAALGGFILIFGFLGFNGGALGSISNPGDGAKVGLIVTNTIIAGSFGAFSCMIIEKFVRGRYWSLIMSVNGGLTGMVAICGAVNAYYPWEAAIVGIGAGPAFHLTSKLVLKLRIDDTLDACAVHGGGGVWGILVAAFLHNQDGIFFRWDKRSGLFLGWQILGLLIVIGWTAITSGIIFGTLRVLRVLRVPEELELKGLDIPKHMEPAYPVEAYGNGHIEKIAYLLEKALPRGRQQNTASYRELSDVGPYEHPEIVGSFHSLQIQSHIE